MRPREWAGHAAAEHHRAGCLNISQEPSGRQRTIWNNRAAEAAVSGGKVGGREKRRKPALAVRSPPVTHTDRRLQPPARRLPCPGSPSVRPTAAPPPGARTT